MERQAIHRGSSLVRELQINTKTGALIAGWNRRKYLLSSGSAGVPFVLR
jgi:hypothetical protein